MKWANGTIFELSGAGNTRLVGTEIISAETDAASGITTLTLKCADGFKPDEFFRARTTEIQTSIDEESGEETETEVITRNGDYLKVTLSAVTSITYDTIPSGCSGGKTVTEDEANTTEALCEILDVSSDGTGHVTLKFDSCDLTVIPAT